MKSEQAPSAANTDPNSAAPLRCQHHFANGSRCRLSAGKGASFCARHAALVQNQSDEADLAAQLTAGLSQFKTPASLNDFLTRLLLLLAQGRISPRRAAVMAYITNQLLRTLAAIQENTPRPVPRIIWNIPGPAYERQAISASPDACPEPAK